MFATVVSTRLFGRRSTFGEEDQLSDLGEPPECPPKRSRDFKTVGVLSLAGPLCGRKKQREKKTHSEGFGLFVGLTRFCLFVCWHDSLCSVFVFHLSQVRLAFIPSVCNYIMSMRHVVLLDRLCLIT